MGMRQDYMIYNFVTHLDLYKKDSSQIIDILGKPNEIHRGLVRTRAKYPEWLLLYFYYFGSNCPDGLPSKHHSTWIEIIFDSTGNLSAIEFGNRG
jgi:hypothetical protein